MGGAKHFPHSPTSVSVASHTWLKGGYGGSITQVAVGGPWGVGSHR